MLSTGGARGEGVAEFACIRSQSSQSSSQSWTTTLHQQVTRSCPHTVPMTAPRCFLYFSFFRNENKLSNSITSEDSFPALLNLDSDSASWLQVTSLYNCPSRFSQITSAGEEGDSQAQESKPRDHLNVWVTSSPPSVIKHNWSQRSGVCIAFHQMPI